MEFLIGRSLANNVTNLCCRPLVDAAARRQGSEAGELLEQEPDAGLGNGGLGRLAACFLDSMATMAMPAMGYGLRYEYGIFRQAIRDGWQVEQPDNWLRRPTRGRSPARRDGRGAARLRSRLHGGHDLGAPGTLAPARRALRSAGGRLRRPDDQHPAPLAGRGPGLLRFRRVQPRRFRRRGVGPVLAETVTRVLYPDDSTPRGRPAFVQEYFLVACSLADIVARFLRRGNDWTALPEKVAIQLNDTHPAMAVAELMRILLDRGQARLGPGWDLTSAPWPTPTTRCCPKPWRSGRSACSRPCCPATWRSSTRSIGASWTTSGSASRR